MKRRVPVKMRKFSRRRFEDLILYIIARCCHCARPEKVRLLLYLIDFHAYASLGRSITGETYTKGKAGPVPVHFDETVERLKKAGKLRAVEALEVVRGRSAALQGREEVGKP